MGDRLPTPPRERKPALAALAAFLILVGALGATTLVMQAGDRIEAIKITERVPAGQPIPESAIISVLVADDSAIDYLPWGRRELLKEQVRPRVDLTAGTVLVTQMLTDEETLGQNEVVVGVSLRPGQFPSGLRAGDTVAAYWVGSNRDAEEGGLQGTVIVDRAKVQDIFGDNTDGRSNLSVTLRVDAGDAPPLVRAASSGDVSLAIVPTATN